MPNVPCGTDLQDAQDLVQEAGVFYSTSEDATGQGRNQILDANWTVVGQRPPAGEPIGEGTAVFLVVKDEEFNGCERPDSTSTSTARSTPPPTTDARRRRRAAQVPTTSVVYDLAVPADCVIRRPVQLGSSGEDVVCLQTRLSEVTPGGGDLGADGDFGPATDAAVREFQAAQGLVVDGIVGAQTAELLAVWDPAPAPTAGTSPPLPAVDLGTDPPFGTCAEAQQNGNTPYERGVDPEYEFYDDRDDDGIVCE